MSERHTVEAETNGNNKPVHPMSHRDKLAMRYQRRDKEFKEFVKSQDMRVHASETFAADAGIYMKDVFLIGVNIFYCRNGAFTLHFSDHDPLVISAGEVMVAFPDRYVTFEAIDTSQTNTLNYTILAGSFAEEYFVSLGYYDLFQCKCAYPQSTLGLIHTILETKDLTAIQPKIELMSLVHSMLLSVLEQAKLQGDAFFYDAVRIINNNVIKGICRIEPVCQELGISRTQIHRIFARSILISPGAYIKDLQYRYGMKLLRVSHLSIAEIASRCGFASSTNFTAFIRKRTGKAPIKHRGKQADQPRSAPSAN